MQFAIAFPPHLRVYEDVRRAEDYGFSYAWFDDSHMCYSELFTTMALAAEHTHRIKLGAFVLVPGNRIAPVTASGLATLNELAPGRIVLNVGTGFTGRNAMGMGPVPLGRLRREISVIRELLRGGEADYCEGDCTRTVRFLHPGMGFINVRDPVPIFMAANAPKAIRTAGEIADGWLTVTNDPAFIRRNLLIVRRAAASAGRTGSPFEVVINAAACVLRPGEGYLSPRVIRRVGPYAILKLHTYWSGREIPAGPFAPPPLKNLARRYRDEYVMAMAAPMEKRFQEMHTGHMIFVKPGEERFLTEELVRETTLTGSASEIIERIKAMEEAGATIVSMRLCGLDGRELISEIGREIIARY